MDGIFMISGDWLEAADLSDLSNGMFAISVGLWTREGRH